MATGDKKKAVMQFDIDTASLSNDATHVPSSPLVKSALSFPTTVEALVTNQLYLIRNGTLRMLVGTGNGCSMPLAAGTIPSADRPSYRVNFPVATQSSPDVYWGALMPDTGEVKLYKQGTEITSSTDWMLFTAVWGV